MEEELQELRDLVAQLKADNEKLRQEQAPVGPPPSATPSTSSAVPIASIPAAERLVFVPRDRKCPMFGGRSGIAQHEGETLLEFSLALMSLMERVKQWAPTRMPNAEVLLRDQFVEQVGDNTLRRELKQFVRRQPTATLLDVRGGGN